MYSAEESRQGKKTQANTGSIGLIRVDLLICAYHIYWHSIEEENRDIAYSQKFIGKCHLRNQREEGQDAGSMDISMQNGASHPQAKNPA